MIEFKNLTRKKIDERVYKLLYKKIFLPRGKAGRKDFELSVVFATPAFMRKLHKNKNADVLSFLYKEEKVGEIFINSREKRKPFLFVHGALHLLGHGHKKIKDARDMKKLETKFLKK